MFKFWIRMTDKSCLFDSYQHFCAFPVWWSLGVEHVTIHLQAEQGIVALRSLDSRYSFPREVALILKTALASRGGC